MDIAVTKLELDKCNEQMVKLSQREPKNPIEFNQLRFEYEKLDLKRTMLMKALEGKD
jgi:hypothetical protein